METQQAAKGDSPQTIESIAKALRYGIVRHDVGEHDMCECSFCGQEGPNDYPGHPYAIKHWPHCPAALYDNFVKGDAGARE